MRASRPGLALVLALPLLASTPARSPAAVADLAENGFTLKNAVTVSATPAAAWKALLEVSRWWDPEHSWSRDASNLSLDARPQGCFCEKLPGGGGVRHLTVVYVDPGRLLRLEGGLGPFQALGLSGVMSWAFQPAGSGTAIELTYVVSGYKPGGFRDLAPIADGVLRGQLERFKRYVDTGKP